MLKRRVSKDFFDDPLATLIYFPEMKRAAMLILGLFLGYVTYLHFPQKFEVGQCFVEEKTNELYKSLSKSERYLNFKDNWFFGPMKINAELVRPNPNTLREVGEQRIFFPASDNLQSAKCE